MSSCATCNASTQALLEDIGVRALEGSISWREAARQAGLTHHQGLKNHMESHFIQQAEASVEAEFDGLIEQALWELQDRMRHAPTELKPLFAVQIQNMRGLKDTKPSQQNLIHASKAIQEILGMKVEQRLMLEFARAAFPGATATPELSAASD